MINGWRRRRQQPSVQAITENGTFSDATVDAPRSAYQYYGFSPRFVDMNGDRYPGVARSPPISCTSKYFINDRGRHVFEWHRRPQAPVSTTTAWDSTVADFNRDGLPDWYVTSIYSDVDVRSRTVTSSTSTRAAIIYTVPYPRLDGAKNGGLGLGHRGAWISTTTVSSIIVETNGWTTPEFVGEPTYLYRNNGDMTFN